MSNLFIRNIPSIKDREFKYRTPISSSEFNSQQKEAFNDLLDLFNKSNQLQRRIYEMNIVNDIESICYSQKLQDALLTIDKLNEMLNNLTNQETEFRTITKYAYEAEYENDSYAALIDKNTNDITSCVVSSTSKTQLYDEVYDEVIVPNSLQCYIGPDSFCVNENIYSIEDNNTDNMFSNTYDNIWFRKVESSTNIESIENEIVIGLPEDIITSKLINQISLYMFPVGYIDIMDIQYKSNGAWQSIPGFTSHHLCSKQQKSDIFGNTKEYYAINDVGNIKFNFKDIQTSQLKIKLRQRNYQYNPETNRRIWYLGIRNINVCYNVYTREQSIFSIVYEFQEKDRNIKVYDSEIFYNNINDENIVYKEYYYFDSDGNTHKISSTCPFILSGHKLMVKYIIEGSQETPNIYSCNVKYKLT